MNNSSAVAEMNDRARAKCDVKWGRMLCPFPWGELGPHLTKCNIRTKKLRPAVWPQYMSRNVGEAAVSSFEGDGVVPLFGGEGRRWVSI